MPTNNKTSNLNLNNWLSTDKPKREDFISDNIILDTIIGNHLNDYNVHLSSDDRSLLEAPFEAGIIVGDGQSSKTHTFDFEPKFVFVFLKNQPFLKYSSSGNYTLCNCGVAMGTFGTVGMSLNGNELTLTQYSTASNNVYVNLNGTNSQYICIAFK